MAKRLPASTKKARMWLSMAKKILRGEAPGNCGNASAYAHNAAESAAMAGVKLSREGRKSDSKKAYQLCRTAEKLGESISRKCRVR